MTDHNKDKSFIIEDAAGMIGGLAGLVSDMRTQIKGDMRSRMKEFADKADLAGQNDVMRLESMINDLSARIEVLEKAILTAKPKK